MAVSKPSDASTMGLSEEEMTRVHKEALTNMDREMYTEHPPVGPEVEEQKHQAALRASAVSMARQLYAAQQKAQQSRDGVDRSSSRAAVAASTHSRAHPAAREYDDSSALPAQYANLQEAAHKLAAERLAKLRDEHAEYREYYGTQEPPKSRLSIRGSRRGRTPSDEEDRAESQRIRNQMTIFNDSIAQIDAEKQRKDREALMAVAQRNVQSRMAKMDQEVFEQTGQVPPAMAAEWEAKARAKAEADSNARLANHGKVAIGGGKYLDQSEIDAIAAARVQPTLDEVTAKAEHMRALDEQRRLEAEEQKKIAEERARDERERNLKAKDRWKAFKGRSFVQ
jgi:hypothetical protein